MKHFFLFLVLSVLLFACKKDELAFQLEGNIIRPLLKVFLFAFMSTHLEEELKNLKPVQKQMAVVISTLQLNAINLNH